MNKSIILVSIFALLVALGIGAAAWWQYSVVELLQQSITTIERRLDELKVRKSTLEDQKAAREREKVVLQEAIDSLRAENEDLRGIVERMKQQRVLLTQDPKENRSIRVLAPNGGEVLCLGNEYEIKWESRNVYRVDLLSLRGGEGGVVARYYPATTTQDRDIQETGVGVYKWKVGKSASWRMFDPGDGYKIEIVSFDRGYGMLDTSDNTFSIIDCRG